jgi:predicted amino acid racemase
LLNIGRDAVSIESLTPLLPGSRILGGSSNYLVVDVTRGRPGLAVGDVLDFGMSYGALLATMNSAYVTKRILSSSRAASED